MKASVTCPGPILTPTKMQSAMVPGPGDEEVLRRQFVGLPVGMDADKCAQVIPRGVAPNRGILVVTALGRPSWWLYRIHPALHKPQAGNRVRMMRAHGVPDEMVAMEGERALSSAARGWVNGIGIGGGDGRR